MPGLGQQGAACLPRHCADVDLRREFEHKLPRAFKPFNATKVSILKRGRGLTLTLTPTLTLTLTPTLTLTLTLEGEQLGARGGALSATPGLLAPIRGVSDEVVAVRIRLHFSTINSRIRLLEAKALAQASRELSGDFDFSLVGRRLNSYHSPPSVAVSEAAGSGQPPISTAARDAFLAHSCERLQRHGFSATHLPPKLREWLRGVGGRQFIKEQRSILLGLEASDMHAREMAWLVRVALLEALEDGPLLPDELPPSRPAQPLAQLGGQVGRAEAVALEPLARARKERIAHGRADLSTCVRVRVRARARARVRVAHGRADRRLPCPG